MSSKTKRAATRVLAGVSCFGWLLVSPLWAQKSMITMDGDVRLFTVLSALHSAGLNFGSTVTPGTSAVRE
ncbi:MAG: hypothetical protein WBN92_11335, partial [Terriglobia bacterium]